MPRPFSLNRLPMPTRWWSKMASSCQRGRRTERRASRSSTGEMPGSCRRAWEADSCPPHLSFPPMKSSLALRSLSLLCTELTRMHRYLFLATRESVLVYSTSTSLLYRRIHLNHHGFVSCLEASSASTSLLYVGTSTGKIVPVDWESGTILDSQT